MTAVSEFEEKITKQCSVLKAAANHVQHTEGRVSSTMLTLQGVSDELEKAILMLTESLERLDAVFDQKVAKSGGKKKFKSREESANAFRSFIEQQQGGNINTRLIPKDIKPDSARMRLMLETSGYRQKGRSTWMKK